MLLSEYCYLMVQAAALGVFQVALGGGNPNQHPDFCELLRLSRETFGILPSYSTNGRGITDAVLEASARHCGAVAVSVYEPFVEAAEAVRRLLLVGVKTNVHFLVDENSVERALGWLRNPPIWLNGINAMIFLNLKPNTRSGVSHLARRHPRIRELMRTATDTSYPFRIGFDSCFATGLLSCGNVDLRSIDSCDAARFSMFVSERMEAYPCSFMANLYEGHHVTDENLGTIWRDGPLFRTMRRALAPDSCTMCDKGVSCRGGCPLFPEVNICRRGADWLDESNAESG